MSLPPLWKVKRELARFGRQIVNAPVTLWQNIYYRRYYDYVLARKKVVHQGARDFSEYLAIYLIYPGQGVLASHFRALEYLRDKGYAVVVVSNLPLQEDEREKLLALSWQIIERPNFGYDFGGYRDGVLQIANELPKLKRLVLLNDSAWFPLPGGADWFDQVDALGVDFAGAASTYGTTRPEISRFREIEWNYRTSHRNFHYGSFGLSISPRILKSRAFLRFWRAYKLTNEKNKTVRRGEIGLTRWTISKGFTHGSTLDIRELDRTLKEMSDDRLERVFENLIIFDERKLVDLKAELLENIADTPRCDIESFILTVVSRQGVSYSLADYTTKELGFPFLKKSPVWLNEDASNITLRIAERLEGPFGKEIREEIKMLRKKKGWDENPK